MKMIYIEKLATTRTVAVNVDSICSVYVDETHANEPVVLRMSCGWGLFTKFTDVASAVDYITQAAQGNQSPLTG